MQQGVRTNQLIELLGISDEELCRIFDTDPISVVSGQLDDRPEMEILLALLNEAILHVNAGIIPVWLRTKGLFGKPIDSLLSRNYAAFERDLEQLIQHGFVLGSNSRS